MNILLLVILSCISLFVLWKIVSVWYDNRLRKDTERRLRNVERMKKETRKLRKKKKAKKLGRKKVKKEKPDFESEEDLEAQGIPSSVIQDEEDIEEDP